MGITASFSAPRCKTAQAAPNIGPVPTQAPPTRRLRPEKGPAPAKALPRPPRPAEAAANQVKAIAKVSGSTD